MGNTKDSTSGAAGSDWGMPTEPFYKQLGALANMHAEDCQSHFNKGLLEGLLIAKGVLNDAIERGSSPSEVQNALKTYIETATKNEALRREKQRVGAQLARLDADIADKVRER